MNIGESDGRTPLLYAAEQEHIGVVKLLLKHGGVNRDIKDDEGQSLLSYAARDERGGTTYAAVKAQRRQCAHQRRQ